MLGVAREVDGASPLPEELDKNIWAWGLPPTAEPNVPIGFLDMTMWSHVLLAACRHNEVAHENPSTKAWFVALSPVVWLIYSTRRKI